MKKVEKNKSLFERLRHKGTVVSVAVIASLGSVTPALSTIDNTVTVSGTAPGGAAGAIQDTDSESVDVVDDNAAVTILKGASLAETNGNTGDGLGEAGDVITYTYTITNSGNTTLNTVGVTDTHDGTGAFATPGFDSWTNQNGSPAATGGDTTITMLPGAIAVFTTTYTITAADISGAGGTGVGLTIDNDIDNSAVANAVYPDGSLTPPAVASSASTAEVALFVNPSLDVAKVGYTGGVPAALGGTGTATNGTTDDLIAGTVVTYVYTVTNDGNVPIQTVGLSDSHGGLGAALSTIVFDSFDAGNTGGSINDDSIDGNANQVDILEPGDIAYFTATYTVDQLDVDQNQ